MKKIIKIIKYLLASLLIILLLICLWHNLSNKFEEKNIVIPGDKIKIYNNEYIHSKKIGSGKYTIVLLPGMGTASPYYDFYKLTNELAKNNRVIVMEPLGYGFSNNTSKKRTLDNYEYELSKVLDYYNIKENIILLGHSYSGLSNLNYANKHHEVKGIVCLDCTTAYQIETHVKDGKFVEEPPTTSKIHTLYSPTGLTRLLYSVFMSNSLNKELLNDVDEKYHKAYKHLLYNKTMNKTIINEIDDIYNNQLELLYKKYREDLYVVTILSSETIENMKEYKKSGDFKKDWEEMHSSLISNNKIQKMHILKGDHYIHHGNVQEIEGKITEMLNNLSQE